MARLARIVIPHVAHHDIQRGNGRLPMFFSDDDRREYLRLVANWRAMLHFGLEAGGVGAAGKQVAEAIEARLRTGRPLATEDWIEKQERLTGQRMRPQKRGPKPKAGGECNDGN